MRELKIIPGQTSLAEVRSWLNECRDEISDAYSRDDIKTAKILSKTYDAVKEMEESVAKANIRDYIKYNMLSEAVTEQGGKVSLIEVDEMKANLDKKLKNATITVDASAKFDTDNKLVEFNPVVLTIKFELDFLEEPQYIVLTYTPTSIPEDFDIDSIPTKDYKAVATDDGVLVTFKSISNLADELGELEFDETIEWPFEMTFKSATIEKKFNKNASLGAKLVALLGSDHLIDKVNGYRSTYSSGSNRQTRAAKEEEKLKQEEEEIRQRVKSNANTGRSRTQILIDMLSNIPGITSAKEFDIPGNGKYYKRIRLTFDGGFFDVMNGGLDFVVKDNADRFGNSREFFTDTDTPGASLARTRAMLVNYIAKRLKAIQAAKNGTTPKRGLLLNRIKAAAEFDVNAEYNSFVKDAEKILTGESDIPISSLEARYNKLLDNERELSDAQMGKLLDYGQELNL